MSTLTQAQPDTAVPARLLSVPLAVTFLAEFTSLTSFFLLLSVVPVLAAAGAGSSGAGLITGSLLLGTVAAETVAAAAIKRFGCRMVLAAGAVLLGAPALALLAREPQAVMVSVSLVRGLGFGLSGVVTGALTARLLPPGRRGEGLGLLGLVSGVPAVVALPAGIWLVGHHLAAVAAAMAAMVGLLPLAAIHWLPGGREARPTARVLRMPGTRSRGRMTGAALRLPLTLAAATIAAGVLDSFLPLAKGIPSNLSAAALLVQAITATLSRWQAGKHGDRCGHARLLIPALAVAAPGMAALMVLGSPVMLFVGMVLFGAGFGVIENATFALLIEQLPEAKASALWNLAYDAGYGAGPAVFGLICIRTGYPAAFALTGALILAAVPAALRQRKAMASVARPGHPVHPHRPQLQARCR